MRIVPVRRNKDEDVDYRIPKFLERFNQLSVNLVGCEFKFTDMKDIDINWKLEDVMALEDHSALFPRFIESNSGEFGFPVIANGICLGILTVAGHIDMDADKLDMISELNNLLALDFFKFSESQTQTSQTSAHGSVAQPSVQPNTSTNVLSLDEMRRNRKPEVMDLATLLNTIEEMAQTHTTQRPLWLEIPQASSNDARQVAIDLHERTGAWAMFSIEDLVAEVFETSSGLRDLGQVTMFISDVKKLTNLQQIRIVEQLSSPDNQLRVIALSYESASDLNARGVVLNHFLEAFQQLNLKPAVYAGEKLTSKLVLEKMNIPDASPRAGKLLEFIPSNQVH